MEIKFSKEKNAAVIHFGGHKPPMFKQEKEGNIVKYGEKDDYADYLVGLYEKSPTHRSILNSKVRFVTGGGWTANVTGDNASKRAIIQNIINNANNEDTLNDVIGKAYLDFRIFGGMALEQIWSNDGETFQLFHIDFAKVRLVNDGEDENGKPTYKYVYLPVWSDRIRKYDQAKEQAGFREWDAYDPDKKGSQLIYWKNHRPLKKGDIDVYPLPDYVGATGYIEADYELQNFDINNIKNQFWGGQIVEMQNVFATDEEKDDFVRNFKREKAGTDNAGSIVFVFKNTSEQVVSLNPLQPSEIDKNIDAVRARAIEQIFISENVVSPMLFGIRTEGQLGGRNELLEAYEILYATEIKPEQDMLEGLVNWLYGQIGITGFNLRAVKPIKFALSESVLTTLLTREQLLEIASEQLGTDLSKDVVQFSKKQQDDPAVLYLEAAGVSADECEVLFECGVDLDEDGNPKLTDREFKKMYFAQELGVGIGEMEANIMSAIQSNPKITVPELSEAFGIEQAEVNNIIESLQGEGLLKGKLGSSLSISKKGQEVIDNEDIVLSVEVRYRYSEIVGIPKAKSGSRDFCKRVLAANRLYTRREIDAIPKSPDAAGSVWAYRGGFYHNPNTNVTTPFCRHFWKSVVVKKRR